MNRTRTSLAAALLALLFAARAGCDTGQQATPDANAWDSRADTRAALLAAGDADSLVAAALLTPAKLSAERLQLVFRAAAAAPARPDLAWLALAACIPDESCDVTPLEARLRAADPGNGAAWMGTLARAAAGTSQFKASLAGVAGSERFDIYWNLFIVHTTDALRRTKTMDDREAMILAIGLDAAQAIPALQKLTVGCKADALTRHPEDLLTCQRVSSTLRHGDTAIIESAGASMARRLWPASSEEYRQAAEESRVIHYRIRTHGERSSATLSDEGARRHLALLAAHRTEQEVVVAELMAAGIDPTPPAAWAEPTS